VHVTDTLFLAAHRAVVIFRVQALVMNIVFGTIFLRLGAERATLPATSAPVFRRDALAVDAAVATVYADVQFA